MNQPAITAAVSRIPLKLEDAPPFGAGAMPAEKERTFALLAHVFSLIVWLWKRNDSPVVDAHGREALNFCLTIFICVFPVGILAGFLPAMIATVVSLLMAVVSLAVLGLLIYGGLKAREGRLLRYPFNFRLIK
jgi:uncharacterized protein